MTLKMISGMEQLDLFQKDKSQKYWDYYIWFGGELSQVPEKNKTPYVLNEYKKRKEIINEK